MQLTGMLMARSLLAMLRTRSPKYSSLVLRRKLPLQCQASRPAPAGRITSSRGRSASSQWMAALCVTKRSAHCSCELTSVRAENRNPCSPLLGLEPDGAAVSQGVHPARRWRGPGCPSA